MGRSRLGPVPGRTAAPLDQAQHRRRRSVRAVLWVLVTLTLLPDAGQQLAALGVAAGAALLFACQAICSRWRQRVTGGLPHVAAIAVLVTLTGGLGSAYEVLFLVALVDDAVFHSQRQLILDAAAVVLSGVLVLLLVEVPGVFEWSGITWLVLRAVSWALVLWFVQHAVWQLRESEQRFRSLFENHPDGASMRDHRGRLLDVNHAMLAMAGLTREEAFAADVWDPDEPVPSTLPEEHRVAAMEALAGRASSCETALTLPGGQRLEIRRTYIPVVVDGAHAGVFAVSQDLTEQRRAEAAKHHLAAIVTYADDAIFSVGLDERVATWNAGAERLLGLSADEAVGRHLEELFGDEYRQHRDAVVAEVLEARPVTFDARVTRTDGSEVDVLTTVSPILGQDGVLEGVALIKRDISTHTRYEESLRRSEERFRSLADRTGGIVYIAEFDPEPRFVYLSRGATDITGHAVEDILADATVPARHAAPGSRLGVERVWEDGELSGVVTYEFRCADGRWIHLEEHFAAVQDEHGRIVGAQGIVFDVSARQEAHQRLQVALEAEQAAVEQYQATLGIQEAFIQAVSHELRTPLTVVLGLAKTLDQHPDLDRDQRQRLIGRLSVNAARLGRLLDDLIDLNRISRDALEVVTQPLVLVDLCQTVVDEMDTNNHRVTIEGEPIVVPVDRARIERAIDNLIRNAIRHTPPGSNVWVRVTSWGDGAMLAVEDDGPGVPDPLKEAVFEPFRQGPAASHDASPGTGIGLNLVAKFVELHGGRVWVEDRQGGGARFVVRLPGAATGAPVSELPQVAGQS